MATKTCKDEKEKSKQRILNSAAKLFAQKGYDGVGIREICRDADANICMVSYFWGGKKGLYKGIVDNLVERQTEYVRKFINFDIEPETLSKKEQVDLLFSFLDKAIDLVYGDFLSKDLFRFLLQEQQGGNIELNSPTFTYIRKLIGAIFNKDYNDRDIIYKMVFILSQMNSPRIMPAFSLSLLKQDNFTEEDIAIIKKNVKIYVNALLKEEGNFQVRS